VTGGVVEVPWCSRFHGAGMEEGPAAVAAALGVTGAGVVELSLEQPPADSLVAGLPLVHDAVAAAEGIEVTDEMIEAWVREQAAEAGEDVDASVEGLLGDPATLTALRQDLQAQKALDIVVENAKAITPEQADAKQKLWTPEKETAQASAKSTPIWTPGSS
jgi:hypothetical protein